MTNLFEYLEVFMRYDRIVVYYDYGQMELTSAVICVLLSVVSNAVLTTATSDAPLTYCAPIALFHTCPQGQALLTAFSGEVWFSLIYCAALASALAFSSKPPRKKYSPLP